MDPAKIWKAEHDHWESAQQKGRVWLVLGAVLVALLLIFLLVWACANDFSQN